MDSSFTCKGLCQTKIDETEYNSNVNRAIASLENHSKTIFLKEKGRHTEEDAILYLKNGEYQGFGFVPKDTPIVTNMDLVPFVQLQENTRETQMIVESYLQQKSEFI